MERFDRNYSMITREEQIKLRDIKVCVIGLGGLGGYIVEMVSRLGIGEITLVDGDVFEISNLNRQLLATMDTIGLSKASVAAKRVNDIDPDIRAHAICQVVDSQNCEDILKGHDVFIDAMDHIDTRVMVSKTCQKLKIPYIYGAIAGWYGMVATILPGDLTMEKLYKTNAIRGEEVNLGNPSFTPSLVASIQVSELLKLVLKRGELIRHGFMHIDLLSNEIEVFNIT